MQSGPRSASLRSIGSLAPPSGVSQSSCFVIVSQPLIVSQPYTQGLDRAEQQLPRRLLGPAQANRYVGRRQIVPVAHPQCHSPIVSQRGYLLLELIRHFPALDMRIQTNIAESGCIVSPSPPVFQQNSTLALIASRLVGDRIGSDAQQPGREWVTNTTLATSKIASHIDQLASSLTMFVRFTAPQCGSPHPTTSYYVRTLNRENGITPK